MQQQQRLRGWNGVPVREQQPHHRSGQVHVQQDQAVSLRQRQRICGGHPARHLQWR